MIRFFIFGIKNTMKYHNASFLYALYKEFYMMFCVMGLKLYYEYGKGTAVFDENGKWINGGKK